MSGGSGLVIKNVTFNTQVLDDFLAITVDSEFGYSYDEDFVERLRLIAADEPAEFIDIKVDGKTLIIRFNDVERVSENKVTIGAALNDEIMDYGTPINYF